MPPDVEVDPVEVVTTTPVVPPINPDPPVLPATFVLPGVGEQALRIPTSDAAKSTFFMFEAPSDERFDQSLGEQQ